MNRLLACSLAASALLLLAACQENNEPRIVGTLERDRVELTVESNEPILSIAVADGAVVRAGDLVLEQDPRRHEQRRAQVQAQRDQAAARLAELMRGPRPELIEEARARLAGSQAARVNAHKRWERSRELFDRGVGQESSVDLNHALWQEALAREQADRESLARLMNGTTAEELQQSEAALAAAEAALEQAQLDLERLAVRAPMKGVLDKVWYEIGERPVPGAAVAVLLDSTRAYARVYLPEPMRAAVAPGDVVDIVIDGRAEPVEGRVRWVASDASFTPYFALTEHDRSRLSYLAEIDLPVAEDWPTGVPLEARLR